MVARLHEVAARRGRAALLHQGPALLPFQPSATLHRGGQRAAFDRGGLGPGECGAALQSRVAAVLDKHGLRYDLVWTIGGLPFLTPPGTLVDAVRDAIRDETGLETQLSTTGGTSDGRFLAQICPQVIELGPPNATIHKINEYVALADIEPLKNIYRRVLERLHTQALA